MFHFGGTECNIHCDAAIFAARMNINKVLRVKYWGGGRGWPLAPLSMYTYCCTVAGIKAKMMIATGNSQTRGCKDNAGLCMEKNFCIIFSIMKHYHSILDLCENSPCTKAFQQTSQNDDKPMQPHFLGS